jgi:hypothetical protein
MNSNDISYSVGPSHFGVFLENYNKGFSQFLNQVTGSFFTQIERDEDNIIQKDTDGILKEKLLEIKSLSQDATKSNYEKATIAGIILSDIARYIYTASDKDILKSGTNIILSFLNVAKETQDQRLMQAALKISDNIAA